LVNWCYWCETKSKLVNQYQNYFFLT